MEDKLLQKIDKINLEVTSLRSLVLLAKVGRNPRVIEADSFLDGGVFLLWCLMNKRNKLLEHLLGEHMIQFWRFAPLKTLLWASLNQNLIVSGTELVDSQLLTTLMHSPAMKSNYVSLLPIQKMNFVCGPLESCAGSENFDTVSGLLAEKPYSAAYLFEMTQKDYHQDF